jgi:hypothetical protein
VRRAGISFCLALAVFAPAAALAVVPTVENQTAVIRALDKVTARVEEIDLPVGKTVQFGDLAILARTCRTTLPEETPPESAAYLEIGEFKSDPQSAAAAPTDKPVFSGWMFASSPALSAMEHPIYDIWVTGCKDSKAPPTVVPSAAPAAAAGPPTDHGAEVVPAAVPPAKPADKPATR